jgi:uncharacterized protein YggT (Ycf19 family)
VRSYVLDVVLAFDFVLAIYAWLAFAAMLLAWLKGFNIVSERTHGVAFIGKYLGMVMEPVLRPIRAAVPIPGVDGSPYLLLLIIMAVRYLMALYLIPKLI